DAVQPVHHSPMSGKNAAVVLNAAMTFDQGREKVAKLADYTSQEAKRQEMGETWQSDPKCQSDQIDCDGCQKAAKQTCCGAFHRFIWADLRIQFSLSVS